MMGGVVRRPMAVMGGSPRAGDAAPARAAAPPPAPPAPPMLLPGFESAGARLVKAGGGPVRSPQAAARVCAPSGEAMSESSSDS